MRKTYLVPFFLFTLLLFPVHSQAAQQNTDANTAYQRDLKKTDDRLKALEQSNAQLQKVNEGAALEKTIDILEKANTALSQRWTPITVILTALSVVFAVITILWGIVFAFAYQLYAKLRDYKAEMSKGLQEFNRQGREAVESIEKEGRNILDQSRDTSKTLTVKEEELRKFEEKAKQTIERLEKSALRVSGAGATAISSIAGTAVWPGLSLTPMDETLTCTKCGALFKKIPPDPLSHMSLPIDISNGRSAHSSLYVGKRSGPLCQRCSKE